MFKHSIIEEQTYNEAIEEHEISVHQRNLKLNKYLNKAKFILKNQNKCLKTVTEGTFLDISNILTKNSKFCNFTINPLFSKTAKKNL